MMMFRSLSAFAQTLLFILCSTACLTAAQDPAESRLTGNSPAQSPYAAVQPGRFGGGLYKARLTPHWLGDTQRFWYRNDLPRGRREYVLVDASSGQRREAFDHPRLAQALATATGETFQADRLSLEGLEYDEALSHLTFRSGQKDWRCNLESYELEEVQDRAIPEGAQAERLSGRRGRRVSSGAGEETSLTFVNRSGRKVSLYWLDGEGVRRSYGELAPNQEHEQHTYEGHVWEVVDEQGRTLGLFRAVAGPSRAVVTTEPVEAGSDESRPVRPDFRGRFSRRGESPDGQWTALVRDHNIVLQPKEGDEIQLTRDGQEGHGYQMLEWSPDSLTLVAFKVKDAPTGEVYLVESSPRGGGRAVLHTRPYALPGDDFDRYELRMFRVADQQEISCQADPVDFGRPRVRWRRNGKCFTYEHVDRGHQRFRLVEVNASTGAVRNLIDEKTDTFIWTAHTLREGPPTVTWLENSEEIVYASERDGWRHLYLVNADTAATVQPLTQGEFVVRAIDRIDEQNRQIWFRASGRNPDQDPYLIHFYRINFDGTNLVALTEGNGTHSIQYSPDERYLIDTYSRVDLAPVHELRRVEDGTLVCKLEEADTSELEARGWQPPEVFSAKGRDGVTDIWGIIYRPRDLDPKKKYPIIEDIYAGPQDSFVPKSFSPRDRYQSLTNLGFIVVKIDGMGTANRSKAFHDVCWKNLKDGGFLDRIAWMRAAAARHPEMDIDRVGIYGTSAGGQNAAAAVLFHPEFYKAAVANCGCHDNRMDKASWNEQWMGYPVGPWYSESSNIDNAERLQGHLLLVVGEMDTNVPPESTYRFVDALIRAGKDFDFLVVPGGGHGAGGAYYQRRMQDFFVRHLTDREPPHRNASSPNRQ